MKWQCPHNEGVECAKKECDTCGWNPEVSERRRKESAIAEGVCPNNPTVMCSRMKCEECGWDPKVAEERGRRARYGLSGDNE